MKYFDGQTVKLGDYVSLTMPDGRETFKVVMLGDSGEHLNLDQQFISWATEESLVTSNSIIVQWIKENPYKHNDPKYAPVGDELFVDISEDVILENRNEKGKHLTNGST